MPDCQRILRILAVFFGVAKLRIFCTSNCLYFSFSRMKTVLITGASGLLGRSLLKGFDAASWNVVGLANTRASGSLHKVNLNDIEATSRVVKQSKVNEQ